MSELDKDDLKINLTKEEYETLKKTIALELEAEKENQIEKCPKCGNENIKQNDKFCHECGFAIKDIKLNQPSEKPIQVQEPKNGRFSRKKKEKEKSRGSKIVKLFGIVSAILVLGTFIWVGTDEVNDKLTVQYISDLDIYKNQIDLLQFNTSLYTISLTEEWEKGIDNGNMDAAIDKFMESQNAKNFIKNIISAKTNAESVYYYQIQPLSVDGQDFSNVPDLLEEVDSASREFSELALNPTGSYLTYSQSRAEKESKAKVSKDKLEKKISSLKDSYGVTDEDIENRKKELGIE